MSVSASLRILGALFLLWCGAAIVPAAASAGVPVATCIRPLLAGQTANAMFADPRGFDCRGSGGARTAGDYWVIAPHLPGVEGNVVVRSGSVWQRSMTLHVRYADGAIRRTGFTSAGAWRHLRLGAIFEVAVPAHAAPPVALLWEIHGATALRGVVLGATIATPQQSARHEVLMAGLYSAFAGLCLALLIYNLALWGALRQWFQPVYCAMVMCLLAYAFTSSGWLGQLAGIDNNIRLRINAVLLGMSAVAALSFARVLFERRVFDGWLGRASTASLVALLAAVVSYSMLAPWQAAAIDRLCTMAFIVALAMVVPILWRAWRLGSPYAGLFALAWGTPIALAACRILAALDLLAWHFWIDNSTILAMGMEAAFSSLAIAYRIKLLSQERDAAREQEMLARMLADRDPLTGLMNRRSFLREAIAGGAASDHQRLLVLIDIDHFKAVNETLGHDGGDEVLRVFARALRQATPPGALLARLGGEEFAILADADPFVLDDGALTETILTAIRGARMPYDIAITASLGSGIGRIASEAEWAHLYRRADQALFAAKRAGRDRSRCAAVAQA